MKGTAKEWAAKAEADFSTATRELQAPESPNFDAVCFQAQQSLDIATRLRANLRTLLGLSI